MLLLVFQRNEQTCHYKNHGRQQDEEHAFAIDACEDHGAHHQDEIDDERMLVNTRFILSSAPQFLQTCVRFMSLVKASMASLWHEGRSLLLMVQSPVFHTLYV